VQNILNSLRSATWTNIYPLFPCVITSLSLHYDLVTRSLSSKMAPKTFKESGDIFQWVNTSKTNRPNFKLVEQNLTTNQSGQTQIPIPIASISQPAIMEPGEDTGGNEDVQLPQDDMHLLGDINNLEFPIKKRKVIHIQNIGFN